MPHGEQSLVLVFYAARVHSNIIYNNNNNNNNNILEDHRSEHGSFTPIVSFSSDWGLSATVPFRRLASLLSKKLRQPLAGHWNLSLQDCFLPAGFCNHVLAKS